MPKKLGGLGILDIKGFNQALLSKWIWQLSKSDEKLWKSIVKALYSNQGNALRESFFFKKHLKCISQFCECFIVRTAGDGSTISFWDEDWGNGILKMRFQALYTFAWHKEITVNEVFTSPDISMFFRHVSTLQASSELRSLIGIATQARITINEGFLDDAIWKGHTTGMFSVKSAYLALKNGPQIKIRLHTLWKLAAPPRFKIFGWLLLLRKILTTDNLNRRGFSLVNICYLCREDEETIAHLFDKCAFSRRLYNHIFNVTFPEYNAHFDTEVSYVNFLMDKTKRKEIRGLMLITLFVLWRERCTRLFREQIKTVEELAQEVQTQWTLTNTVEGTSIAGIF